MITTIKGAMRSQRYKAQKLFVLTDAGAHFKYRFCVIGLPAKLYSLTRYFRTEIEACSYFEEVLERNKDFVLNENRNFDSYNFEIKKRGVEMRSLCRRLRKKCAFTCKMGGKKK